MKFNLIFQKDLFIFLQKENNFPREYRSKMDKNVLSKLK